MMNFFTTASEILRLSGPSVLLLASFLGWGSALIDLMLARGRRPSHGNDGLLLWMTSLFLGAMFCSQILYYSLRFSADTELNIYLFKLAGIALLVGALFRAHRRSRIASTTSMSMSVPVILCLSGVAAFTLAVLVGNLGTLSVHGDAQHYHLAFPWVMSQTGRLFDDKTFLHVGTYLGWDIVYLALDNLAGLPNGPDLILKLKIFNTITGFGFAAATYLLCRAMGGSPIASALAMFSVFTASSLIHWGEMKNDDVLAAVVLLSLAILLKAQDESDDRWFFLAGLMAGFAVTIKISAVIPLLLPFLLALVSRRFSLLSAGLSFIGAVLTIAPWAIYAQEVKGNFLHPLGMQISPEIRDAWVQRNANGIPRDLLSFIQHFPQLLLDKYHVPGNESLGLPFVVALACATVAVLLSIKRRNFTPSEVVALSGIAWLVLFAIDRYHERFLSRYILCSVGIVFAYFYCWVERVAFFQNRSIGRPGMYLWIFALAVLAFTSNAAKRHFERAGFALQTPPQQLVERRESEFSRLVAVSRRVESVRKANEGIAVNDGALLFLRPPVINLHGMHAIDLNLYVKSWKFLRNLGQEKELRLLAFRRGISGSTPALLEFIDHCAVKTETIGPIDLYLLDYGLSSCSDPVG